jgi:hypothetical protein
MRKPARRVAVALALAAAVGAGCGTAAPAAHGPAAAAPSAGAPLLATSMVTASGTWATVVMGGSAASHNNFWQLFIRPAGSQRWKLVTPPGVPDNGGLVLAARGGQSLITGFRPSQYLTYTPLTQTRDGGRAWSSTGPLDGALANVPDALAAGSGTGDLLALTTDGAAKLAAPGYTRWATLTTRRSLAVTPAGRRCGLRELTAAAFSPSGQPLLAGACSRPGAVGVFAHVSGTWQAAGPAIPAAVARHPITVLRLTETVNQTVALLAAGTGHAATLLAAWSADNGRRWKLSPALRLGGATLASASFGPAGAAAVLTTGGSAAVITGAASSWRTLPALPPGAATLALGQGDQVDALAVHRGTLTVWQLPPGGGTWAKTQVIKVPIPYGSSG